MIALVAVAGLLATLAACSASNDDSTEFASKGASGKSGASGSGNEGGAAGASGGIVGGSSGSAGNVEPVGGASGAAGSAGSTADGCVDGVGEYILVVSSENVLLKFYPGNNYTFEKVGDLSCPANGSTPFSMALDRTGKAWVLYANGKIFHVNSTTAECIGVPYQAGQQGWDTFGMGFVSDAPGSSTETLFVIDGTDLGSSEGLGKIDPMSLQLSKIGQFDSGLSGRSAEVTGRGDARLFGFFVDLDGFDHPSVAEIEKSSGHIITKDVQNSVPATINAWAFAHWGGSFYMFTGTSGDASRVDKFTPAATVNGVSMPATTTQVVNQVKLGGQTFSIVGAGVSTCAPTDDPIQ